MHISNFPGCYCDSCNQLLGIVNGGDINQCLHIPHKKKSRHDRSDVRAGQRTGPPRPIHCWSNLTSRNFTAEMGRRPIVLEPYCLSRRCRNLFVT
ncbi:hypothetical protein AVEN_120071-1 [Araneus ventricosus]|uniref:Uncharacterized protein n=1 Tax=Araneus ventricosus TaxID=182803 RepID=A0A4Y2G498_ARAVE|nr:hypothetical protein AVEN_120071-1 [Araneus ventricosus]